MGITIKIHDPLFCTDQIVVITNFAVITNVVIKRANCTVFPLPAIYFAD